MQKDLPKPEELLPEPELELQATTSPASQSKSNLQLLILAITIFFLLGVFASIVFFLYKN